MSVENYMGLYGIKLTRPKRSRSPLQQPFAPLVSAQSLHVRTTPEPAMAQLASASMPRQQSSPQGCCDSEADSEGEQDEEDSQQREDAQAVSASVATVSTDRQRCSHADAEADPPWAPTPTDAKLKTADDMMLDEPLDADVDLNDDRGPMLNESVQNLQPSHVQQEDASDDDMVRPCTEQCN